MVAAQHPFDQLLELAARSGHGCRSGCVADRGGARGAGADLLGGLQAGLAGTVGQADPGWRHERPLYVRAMKYHVLQRRVTAPLAMLALASCLAACSGAAVLDVLTPSPEDQPTQAAITPTPIPVQPTATAVLPAGEVLAHARRVAERFNQLPPGAVSIRLSFRFGSLEEADKIGRAHV